MPPVALTDTRTTSFSTPSSFTGLGDCFSLYRNDLSRLLVGKQYGIWLPNGGQTSPIREDSQSAPGVEIPLDAVRKRVCAEAFRVIENLKASDDATTMRQIHLAHSLLTSLQTQILDAPSSYTQFSTVRLGIMGDGELVLEWFFDRGRIQFFIDAELEDSMAVFLDGRNEAPLPTIENMPISAADIDSVTQRALDLAMELA